MKVVAGIDIGNSTTEIVLLAADSGQGDVVASVRAVTRGAKGSLESVGAAGRLARRTATRMEADIVLACAAPWRPVHTQCQAVEREMPDTAPLMLVSRSATTAAGDSAGVGRPVLVRALSGADDPVVALADSSTGYAETAARVNAAVRAGTEVVGVLVERDEAVLVANRLDHPLPVIDQVPVAQLVTADLVALEARPAGQPLRQLADPFWVASSMGMESAEGPVGTVVLELQDASFAVLARHAGPTPARVPSRAQDQVVWRSGAQEPLLEASSRIRSGLVGEVSRVDWADASGISVDDLFVVMLDEIARDAHTRRGTITTTSAVTAALAARDDQAARPADLEAVLQAPVMMALSETHAGRAGALSTPGAPTDAIVVDLGGGTVDLSEPDRRCVAAGAGEMLTRVAAEALDVPTGTAEYAKRGPALHVDTPQVVVDENGGRAFLDTPAPSSTVGALCVRGPVGLAAFNRSLALGEWRAWRATAKTHVIGRNVARALETVGVSGPSRVVLVGGAAGDDEAVTAVSRSLPLGSTIGRGNVGGVLGHRFAVAYGLAREGVSEQ